MNTVNLIGNLTKDVELKHLPSGMCIANFSLAYNKKIKGEDKTSFFSCVAFKGTAELLEKYTSKGSKIGITGELNQERWQDKSTGENKSKVVLNVNKVELLSKAQTTTQESVNQFAHDEIPF